MGMPVARRGGPGKATLYDLDQVLAWIARTGRGMRPELPAMPRYADVCTPEARADLDTRNGAASLLPAEELMARVLEEGLGGIVAMMLAHGIPGNVALSMYDGLVVATYSVLEEHTGRSDSMIPMDGALGLLLDDAGREKILEHARRAAATMGTAGPIVLEANAREQLAHTH
jgi:hypothetical protein